MGKYEVTYEEKFIIVKEHGENHKALKAVCEEYDISKIPTWPTVPFTHFSYKDRNEKSYNLLNSSLAAQWYRKGGVLYMSLRFLESHLKG